MPSIIDSRLIVVSFAACVDDVVGVASVGRCAEYRARWRQESKRALCHPSR